MRIDFRKLKKYQVETVSGKKLGKVCGIIFDTEGQMVAQYLVGTIFSMKLLVSRDQVARFEEKKLIVDDSVVQKIPTKSPEPRISKKTPEPIAMIEE